MSLFPYNKWISFAVFRKWPSLFNMFQFILIWFVLWCICVATGPECSSSQNSAMKLAITSHRNSSGYWVAQVGQICVLLMVSQFCYPLKSQVAWAIRGSEKGITPFPLFSFLIYFIPLTVFLFFFFYFLFVLSFFILLFLSIHPPISFTFSICSPLTLIFFMLLFLLFFLLPVYSCSPFSVFQEKVSMVQHQQNIYKAWQYCPLPCWQ